VKFPNLWLFCSNFVNKSCFIVKAVSRIFLLDLMMKSVQFQVKKRLSHEVLKGTVELSSSVGLSVHPSLSADSTCLAQ